MKHDGDGGINLERKDLLRTLAAGALGAAVPVVIALLGAAVVWGGDRHRLQMIEARLLTSQEVRVIVREEMAEPLRGLRRDVDRLEIGYRDWLRQGYRTGNNAGIGADIEPDPD